MAQNDIRYARILLLRHFFQPVLVPHKNRCRILPAEITVRLSLLYRLSVAQMVVSHYQNTFAGQERGKFIISVYIFRHAVHDLHNTHRPFRLRDPPDGMYLMLSVSRLKVKFLFLYHCGSFLIPCMPIVQSHSAYFSACRHRTLRRHQRQFTFRVFCTQQHSFGHHPRDLPRLQVD